MRAVVIAFIGSLTLLLVCCSHWVLMIGSNLRTAKAQAAEGVAVQDGGRCWHVAFTCESVRLALAKARLKDWQGPAPLECERCGWMVQE